MLFGRAVNIFPLSYLLNFFRDHKITPKMMFIMWFSGESSLFFFFLTGRLVSGILNELQRENACYEGPGLGESAHGRP